MSGNQWLIKQSSVGFGKGRGSHCFGAQEWICTKVRSHYTSGTETLAGIPCSFPSLGEVPCLPDFRAGWRTCSQKTSSLSLPVVTLSVSPRTKVLCPWSEGSIPWGQRGDKPCLLSQDIGKGEVGGVSVAWLVWANVSCSRKAAVRENPVRLFHPRPLSLLHLLSLGSEKAQLLIEKHERGMPAQRWKKNNGRSCSAKTTVP